MSKIITNGDANVIIKDAGFLSPIDKCPTWSELNSTGKFVIDGSYTTNQLVQKEHVSKKADYTYGLFVLNTPVYATYDISFSDGKRFNGSTSTDERMWLQAMNSTKKVWSLGVSTGSTTKCIINGRTITSVLWMEDSHFLNFKLYLIIN